MVLATSRFIRGKPGVRRAAMTLVVATTLGSSMCLVACQGEGHSSAKRSTPPLRLIPWQRAVYAGRETVAIGVGTGIDSVPRFATVRRTVGGNEVSLYGPAPRTSSLVRVVRCFRVSDPRLRSRRRITDGARRNPRRTLARTDLVRKLDLRSGSCRRLPVRQRQNAPSQPAS